MAKKKILVVDDETDLVEMIVLRLEANDFTVIKAYDGQVALDLARTEKPDLIILDLMLPKIDGYKVCRMLKFDEKYKSIPVILFTAAPSTDEKMALLKDPHLGILVKPVSLAQMKTEIERYLV